MMRVHKTITAGVALALGGLMLTGCAAIRELVAEAPIDVPTALPSLPAGAEPFEKIYQGGTTPEGLSEEEWATKSERRIVAAAALHKILVYGVDHADSSDGLVVKIKGDPEDAQLIADVEEFVVPVALKWAPTVSVIIDPSLCGIVGEVRDESPVCDALTGS